MTNWECGECGVPIQLFAGKKTGLIYYNCGCGASVNLKVGTRKWKEAKEAMEKGD